MILAIIIGMSLVTMIPRVIPVYIADKVIFPEWANRWLNAVPYAALGALIFPGIMSVKEGDPHVGIIGGIVAIILSFIGWNVIFVVLGAILTVFLIMVI